jgi:hypothetical protein
MRLENETVEFTSVFVCPQKPTAVTSRGYTSYKSVEVATVACQTSRALCTDGELERVLTQVRHRFIRFGSSGNLVECNQLTWSSQLAPT